MLYTAYGKECKLSTNELFEGVFSVRAEYKKDGDWEYIEGVQLNDISTKAKCSAEYERALGIINIKMDVLFGKVVEPSIGIKRIDWLIDNQTIVENNELRLK